ncbi:MAG: F0F1 ATP synthase subunit alpha, partial [Gammaproteobacteria bacterium]|nr:F0F1 ATP synthase subunit alpha [Gammaproteobacteria bacterium]
MLSTNLKTTELINRQADWLKGYRPEMRIKEQGKVISIGDGIVWISGLPMAAIDDILVFADGSRAMVFDLTEQQVGAVLLQQTEKLTAGTTVCLTDKLLSVPAGDS